jgi:uncharacterized protein (TIGR00645 family)
MHQIERGFESAIYLSRWLVAPFLAGLIVGLMVLLYRFVVDLIEVVVHLPRAAGHEVIVGVLNLVDFALTANLILIVVFSGYSNYIRKVDAAEHPDWPDGITHVDFGALKQKLLGSIVAIAAVDALAWYLDLEKYSDTSKLAWAIAFPIMFVLAMLVLAIAERLGSAKKDAE